MDARNLRADDRFVIPGDDRVWTVRFIGMDKTIGGERYALATIPGFNSARFYNGEEVLPVE